MSRVRLLLSPSSSLACTTSWHLIYMSDHAPMHKLRGGANTARATLQMQKVMCSGVHHRRWVIIDSAALQERGNVSALQMSYVWRYITADTPCVILHHSRQTMCDTTADESRVVLQSLRMSHVWCCITAGESFVALQHSR